MTNQNANESNKDAVYFAKTGRMAGFAAMTQRATDIGGLFPNYHDYEAIGPTWGWGVGLEIWK